MKFTLTISPGKEQKIIDAMKGLYPIILDSDGNPLFQDEEWVREAIKIRIKRDVKKWEEIQAHDAVDIREDEELVD